MLERVGINLRNCSKATSTTESSATSSTPACPSSHSTFTTLCSFVSPLLFCSDDVVSYAICAAQSICFTRVQRDRIWECLPTLRMRLKECSRQIAKKTSWGAWELGGVRIRTLIEKCQTAIAFLPLLQGKRGKWMRKCSVLCSGHKASIHTIE